jgi:hypothetical protein
VAYCSTIKSNEFLTPVARMGFPDFMLNDKEPATKSTCCVRSHLAEVLEQVQLVSVGSEIKVVASGVG